MKNDGPTKDAKEKGLSPQGLTLLLWGSVGLANAILSLIGSNRWTETVRVISASGCGLLLSLLLSVATRHVIELRSAYRWIPLGALVLLGGSSLWAIDVTLQVQSFGQGPIHWPTRANLLGLRLNIVYFNLIFTLQTAAQALLSSNKTLRARERQLAESRLDAQQAQLAALRFQLNPHFLFNSLNAISTLAAEAGARDAETMLDRLADFLRASLSSDPQHFIHLDSELETVQAYLDIEFVRFGERMNVRYFYAAELRDALVPSLILQPLVENAVKYAVGPSKTMVQITVTAKKAGNDLILAVTDEAEVRAPVKTFDWSTGVGLKNVAARLQVLYQDRAELTVQQSEGGFTATIRLPFESPSAIRGVSDARLLGGR